MIDDSDQLEWLHSPEKLQARADCLLRILKAFGGQLAPSGEPLHSPEVLYGVCHDYLSHGNTDPDGVIGFYLTNKGAYQK